MSALQKEHQEIHIQKTQKNLHEQKHYQFIFSRKQQEISGLTTLKEVILIRKIFFAVLFVFVVFSGNSQTATDENLLTDKQSLRGRASWYGPGFFHRETASGKVYGVNDIFVAHKSYPFGTLLEIMNLKNGKRIIAPVKDRGPYVSGRAVDLSFAAAKALSVFDDGVVHILFKPIIMK